MTRRLALIILTSLGLGFLCWRTLRAAKQERDALNAHIARMQTMRVPAARVLPDRDGIVYATAVSEHRPWDVEGWDDYAQEQSDLHAVAPGTKDEYVGFTFAHDAEPPFTFNRTQFDKDLTELRDKGTPPPSSPAAFRHYFEGRQ